jgi:hypothetical protein
MFSQNIAFRRHGFGSKQTDMFTHFHQPLSFYSLKVCHYYRTNQQLGSLNATFYFSMGTPVCDAGKELWLLCSGGVLYYAIFWGSIIIIPKRSFLGDKGLNRTFMHP